MRIALAATAKIALPLLEYLVQHRTFVCLLTRTQKPKGRGLLKIDSPLLMRAKTLGVAVLEYDSLRLEEREHIKYYKPDLLLVFAYGRILGPKFLASFPKGSFNVHPSLLPKYRGPSPLIAAILNGDRQTGISLQTISPEIDAGDLVLQEILELPEKSTLEELEQKVASKVPQLAEDLLLKLENNSLTFKKQDSCLATYTSKIKKEDGWINWTYHTAQDIERMVRAYQSWPSVKTLWQGKALSLLEVGIYWDIKEKDLKSMPLGTVCMVDEAQGIVIVTKQGFLRVNRLQLEGRKALCFRDFLRGHPSLAGSQLGSMI